MSSVRESKRNRTNQAANSESQSALSAEEVQKIQEKLEKYKRLYEESQRTKDHLNDSDYDDDLEYLNDDSSRKRQSRSRSSFRTTDRTRDILIDRINKIPIGPSLDLMGSNWETWSANVLRYMDHHGCTPEEIEATTDPKRQRLLDSALFTLLSNQAGPNFQKQLLHYGKSHHGHEGRAAWAQLQIAFKKQPGETNLDKVTALLQCLRKYLDNSLESMSENEIMVWFMELYNTQCELLATGITLHDCMFLINLLPRIRYMGPQTTAIYGKAIKLTEYSKELFQELRNTEREVAQQCTLKGKSGYSAGNPEPTHLQANSFHPSRNKFKCQKRPTFQNNNSGGAQQPFPQRNKCSHCGYSNHAEANCKFLTAICPICNQVGHRPSVCPRRSLRQQKSNNKRQRHNSTPPYKGLALHNAPFDQGPFHANFSVNLLTINHLKSEPKSAETTSEGFLLDSGCNLHVTPNLALLSNYENINPLSMDAAQGSSVPILGKGTLEARVRSTSGRIVPLTLTVYYAPSLAHTLLSTSIMTQQGFSFFFSQDSDRMTTPHGEVITLGQQSDIPMLIPVKAPKVNALQLRKAQKLSYKGIDWLEAHLKLGHASIPRIASSIGVSASQIDFLCMDCKVANFERIPVTKGPHTPYTKSPRQAVTADVMGPFHVLGVPNKFKYAIVYRDLYSDFTYVYPIQSTDQVSTTLRTFAQAWLQGKNTSRIIIRTDGAKYFTGGEFARSLHTMRWEHKLSAPHSHATNPAEGINRVLMNGLRSNLKTALLGAKYWPYALSHAVHVKNRTASSRNRKSPYERHFGKAPDYSYFHIFGAPCVFKKFPIPQKLGDRGELGIFLGYADSYSHGTVHVLPKDKSNILQTREVKIFDQALTEQTRQRAMSIETALTPDLITHWTREESNKLIAGEMYQDLPALSSAANNTKSFLTPNTPEYTDDRESNSEHASRPEVNNDDRESNSEHASRLEANHNDRESNSEHASHPEPNHNDRESSSEHASHSEPNHNDRESSSEHASHPEPNHNDRESSSEHASHPELNHNDRESNSEHVSHSEVNNDDRESKSEHAREDMELEHSSVHAHDSHRRSKRTPKPHVPLNVGPSAKGAANKYRYYTNRLKRKRNMTNTELDFSDINSLSKEENLHELIIPTIYPREQEYFAFLIKTNTDNKQLPNPVPKPCPYDDIVVPNTYKEMRKLPQAYQQLWIAAMNTEHHNLQSAGVLETVPLHTLPQGQTVMGTRWVFTKKAPPVNLLKARVVVQGYNEAIEHVYDIYSPTVNVESIRVATIIALTRGYDAITVDVTAAFLEAQIPDDEFLYIKGIEGLDLAEGYCYRLRKSPYGLKSAPRRWMDHLTAILENYGLTRSITDASLFIGKDLLMTIHVDDMRIFGTPQALKAIVKELEQNVGVKVNREKQCHYLSDTHVYDKSRKICTISQREYCEKALRRCNMENCNGAKTPSILKELSDHPDDSVNEHYRPLVGTLMYLLKTRPDMAYTLHQLACHGQKNGAEHMQALKHAFRYVKATKDKVLTLKGVDSEAQLVLNVYTDASFSKAHDKLRRSVTGYVVMINDSAVVWKTTKQSTVARNTHEAELIAAVAGVLRAESIRQLLADMNIYINEIQVYIDCQALVNTIKKEEVNGTNGYLAVQLAVLIHRRQNQLLKVHHVKGTENIADLLTKPLAAPSHWKHASRLLDASGADA